MHCYSPDFIKSLIWIYE